MRKRENKIGEKGMGNMHMIDTNNNKRVYFSHVNFKHFKNWIFFLHLILCPTFKVAQNIYIYTFFELYRHTLAFIKCNAYFELLLLNVS